MSASVQVLCPNGRRQNVKITPNSKLLQVLEEVCKKQGFLPPEEYELKHGRNTLDIGLSFRYSNLPNNAKLELVKAAKARTETTVIIALQLETGERLQHEFDPGVTLWELLQYWEQKPEAEQQQLTSIKKDGDTELHPVCLYMREDVIGELALKATSLRSLGLTGGKAIIRCLHRPIDSATLEQIRQRLEKEQVKQAKLDALNYQRQKSEEAELPKKQNAIPTSTGSSETSMDTQSAESIAMDTESSENSAFQSRKRETEISPPGTSHKESKLEQVVEAMETDQQQAPSSDVSTASTDSVVLSGGVPTGIPGVTMFRPGAGEFSADQQQYIMDVAQSILGQMTAGNGPQQQQPSQGRGARPRQVLQPTPSPFADFKFPEETKGKELYKNELSEVSREDFKPCDREIVVYRVDEPVSISPDQGDVPDSFFEVTEHDVRRMMKDLQKSVKDMSDQPLMTQSMRKAELEEKFSKYERAVVRFHFPDKVVVQALFRPLETVFALTKFVKEHLDDRTMSFYLYTTPPKTVLKDPSNNLIEAGLVPASVVYVGTESQKEKYLSAQVMCTKSTLLEAEKTAMNWHYKHTMSQPGVSGASTSGASGGATAGTSASGIGASGNTRSAAPTGSGNTGEKKTPKWLKIGKS
ncbi:tether containing UBX domain for GLUT4 isoform X2 [Lingula anatina]|uniref:Tether containing UBX domain for GLUT4 isoform X2 n=1 Tax=Lingula anatina TaxID=7574 RepID=A0A1S3HPF3_LINAN|nr:tether containing UBX domain for GLUT4 isoform X2 [Lingula anatina]|eukprot:XP_013387421.1 tether containing UBX domain for GLUT4 isoform X2 [Lingula anatina]